MDTLIENARQAIEALLAARTRELEALRAELNALRADHEALRRQVAALAGEAPATPEKPAALELPEIPELPETSEKPETPEKPEPPAWPRQHYADAYNSFQPLGFLPDDLADEAADPLFIIEQTGPDAATYRINTELEFGRLLSNYKYVLKDVCQVQQRTEQPTHMTVEQPGQLQLRDGVWAITVKVTINII